jgi:hypothetical protein
MMARFKKWALGGELLKLAFELGSGIRDLLGLGLEDLAGAGTRSESCDAEVSGDGEQHNEQEGKSAVLGCHFLLGW